MQHKRFVDFDLFKKEAKGHQEPVVVRLFGKEYHLPAVLPASVMVNILEMQGQEAEEIPPMKIVDIARGLLGQRVMDSILAEQDFSLDDLGELVKMVIQEYSPQVEEAEEIPLEQSD